MRLQEISERAAHLHEHVEAPAEAEADELAGADVPALLAEIERLRAEREANHRTWRQDLSKLREALAEAEQLRNRLHSAAMTRTWRLENGKRFVYVEDIAPHLLGTTQGGES